MKTYVLDRYFVTGVDLLKQHTEVVLWSDPESRTWWNDAEALMIRRFPITRRDLEKTSKLRVIGKQGAGVENIDLEAAKDFGVTVFSTPGVNAEAVAELAVALSLGVARKLGEFDRRIRAGEVVERSDHLGVGLSGGTVGIVGMGNIGNRVARKWHGGFGCKVLAYDPYAPADTWPDIPHVRVQALEDLLPEVDLLTLHLPLSPETERLIGRKELGLLASSAILVNVSRGGIIDERALYDALLSGKLYGAGIDTYQDEPVTSRNPLVGLSNVLSTPHAGGGTVQNQANSSLVVAQELLDVLSGKEPAHRLA